MTDQKFKFLTLGPCWSTENGILVAHRRKRTLLDLVVAFHIFSILTNIIVDS